MKNTTLRIILCFAFPLFAQKAAFNCPALDSLQLPECGEIFLTHGKKTAAPCETQKRLLPFISYLTTKEKPCSTIATEVKKRLDFFHDTTTFKIKTDKIQWFGDTSAPLSIVMYVSMMCPHCKQLYGQFYDTLTTDKNLAKQIRIGLKNLSVTEYDQMLAATARLGKQPRFLRVFGRMSSRASDETMQRTADSIGISFDSLKTLANEVSTARTVNSSREEALRNGVTSTPAIFINNHRYQSLKEINWILEAAVGMKTKK